MQTTPIANLTNLISSAPPANKQAESTAPATPFKQVLSREVADRSNAARTNEPRAADASPARPGKETQATPAQAKSGEAKAADKKQASEETDDAAATDTTTATTPADMLALVASLNPARPSTDAPAEKKDLKDGADATKSGVDTATLAAAVAGTATVALRATGVAGDKAAVPAGDAIKLTANGERSAVAADGKPVLAMDRGNARSAGAEQPLTDDLGQDAASSGKQALQDFAAKSTHDASGKLADAASASNDAASQKTDFAADVKDALSAVQASASQLPQAALHAVNAAGAAATHLADRLTPQVGTPGWDKALGQKITWMVAGEQQTASLTLNPPDLGPLQVVLSVSNSQANAAFTSAQPEVRQALEAAMPKLREMLNDAGIQLGQATVNSGSSNQQSAQDQKQFQPGTARMGTDDVRSEPAIRVGRVQPAAPSGRGLVDTFV